MYDDDDTTFSLVSTASVTDATSITTRTELELDHGDEDAEFAGVSDVTSDFESGWEVSSGPSTSVPPSVYEDEIAYGRRYHGFRRGIYPMPNDEVERHREETVHALFLQLMVRPRKRGIRLRFGGCFASRWRYAADAIGLVGTNGRSNAHMFGL